MAYRSERRGHPYRKPVVGRKGYRLCRYYMQGSCKRGAACDFIHDPSRKQNIEYDNPNEAREGEEELPFSSRSDFTFVVGHGKCKLSKFISKTLHLNAYLCMHGISRWKLFGSTYGGL